MEAVAMISSEVSQGVDLKSLRAGSLIDVQTNSRRYRIEYLGGNTIRISGHPEYCPDPELAQLQGSIDNEGVVEVDLIEPGMRLIFVLTNRRPVTTSRVLTVHVDQTNAVDPHSSASIY
jgi:hypothetical protein